MSATPGPTVTPRAGILRSPVTWLGVVVAVYFAASLALSLLRLSELHTSTWDLGIFQQALWSGPLRGPFYEAADFETAGVTSFFQVHPAFLLYALAPLYAAFPYAVTLLTLQSFVVAVAAVPLFFIGAQVTGSRWKGFASAGLYLVWTPTLAANLFDFHLEAFLPVEVFACFLFWLRKQYLVGAAFAVLASITIEAGPVYVFLVGLFFALPPIREGVRQARIAIASAGSQSRSRAFFRYLGQSSAKWLRRSDVQASLGLMVAAVLAYYGLRYAEAHAFGTAPSVFTAFSGTAQSLFQLRLTLSNLSVGFYNKVAYWGIILGLAAFLPFRAPRTFLLIAPWMGFSFLNVHAGNWELGFQSGFLYAIPVMIGVAYGLVGLELRPPPRAMEAAASSPPESPSPPAPSRSRTGWLGLDSSKPAPWMYGLFVIAGVSLALSPINPYMFGTGSGYLLTIPDSPGYPNAQFVADMVPAGATVLATPDLFSFVADDVSAYTLTGIVGGLPYLPFNASHLPAYVLITEKDRSMLPSWLSTDLYQPSRYGLLAWTGLSPRGVAMLFMFGYAGPAEAVAPIVPSYESFSGSQLVLDPSGTLSTGVASGCVYTIASTPKSPGGIWNTAGQSLGTGNYSVEAVVSAWTPPGSSAPSAKTVVMTLTSEAWAQAQETVGSYTYGELSSGCYVAYFNLSVPVPLLNWVVHGFSKEPGVVVGLSYLAVAPRS